ncbi:hypothetical protein FF38_06505 [Lucilia cuprina]|uniref:Uncharacterized protein n=1 Tax=Lucilia cuprina TaxID=7375 RepID=A0A0L0C596_LUCCU|nr:hypothetical protein FF38_06505 [Lucilia cuprina]
MKNETKNITKNDILNEFYKLCQNASLNSLFEKTAKSLEITPIHFGKDNCTDDPNNIQVFTKSSTKKCLSNAVLVDNGVSEISNSEVPSTPIEIINAIEINNGKVPSTPKKFSAEDKELSKDPTPTSQKCLSSAYVEAILTKKSLKNLENPNIYREVIKENFHDYSDNMEEICVHCGTKIDENSYRCTDCSRPACSGCYGFHYAAKTNNTAHKCIFCKQ